MNDLKNMAVKLLELDINNLYNRNGMTLEKLRAAIRRFDSYKTLERISSRKDADEYVSLEAEMYAW